MRSFNRPFYSVVGLVNPLSEHEVKVDLLLIQTFFLFLWKDDLCFINIYLVSIRTTWFTYYNRQGRKKNKVNYHLVSICYYKMGYLVISMYLYMLISCFVIFHLQLKFEVVMFLEVHAKTYTCCYHFSCFQMLFPILQILSKYNPPPTPTKHKTGQG